MTAILAIDCATGPCSAAVWNEGRIAAYVETTAPVVQSARLLPMIEEALAKSRLAYKDLSAVATTIGPGSFTGIRVGLAAARGIGFAANIPVLGFTTLEVLYFAALPEAGKQKILAVINAGKGEVYYQHYETSPWKPLSDAQLGTLEAAVATSPSALMVGHAASPITFPRADALAELAAKHGHMARDPKPFYIRPPDAKLPQTAY